MEQHNLLAEFADIISENTALFSHLSSISNLTRWNYHSTCQEAFPRQESSLPTIKFSGAMLVSTWGISIQFHDFVVPSPQSAIWPAHLPLPTFAWAMVGCGIFVIIVQHCRCAWWESLASSNNHKDFVSHISRRLAYTTLGKGKSSKVPLKGYM